MFWSNEGFLPVNDPRLAAPLDAVARAVADVQEQIPIEVSEEEPISQRLAQAVRSELKALPEVHGVRWNARIVTAKKHTEAQHGTDLAIWVDIDLAADAGGPAYSARKTVLVQAKRTDKLSSEMPELREQVTRMKAITDSVGVFVVGEDEMWAADGTAVNGATTPEGLRELGRPIPEFFAAMFRCQVGDKQWDSPEQLRNKLQATTYLLIDGFQRGRRRRRAAFSR